MKNSTTIIAAVTIAITVIVGVWWLFYFLWNTIAAEIFGAPELTFWQSVGLLMLISLLTSGLRAATKSK